MELNVDQKLHGFAVTGKQDLPEISGTAYTLVHQESGARLLYLSNADNNKAFAIGFRTPPKDDTGVFHILEHSVLCGSDKFPVKEPFVDLLKSSAQTFLNAMTFADKTLYPVASTNEHDLQNLMDVYLDAVFHPAIYHKKAIFEQEGWHYELTEAASATEDANEAAAIVNETAADNALKDDAAKANLVYNGVVFNEMKGALSDSSSVLYDELQKALFPHTAYAFESGGTPEAIPSLTYDEYLNEHRRHYQLSNSYTVLYGNLDISHMLDWMNERYFTPVAREQKQAREEREAGGLSPFEPRTIEAEAPVHQLGLVKHMETAPENAVAGLAFVIGDASQRTRVIATDILLDALFGSNEAPAKRALLDAGIADDVQAFVADGMKQPFAVVQLRKQRDLEAKGFSAQLEGVIRGILEEGIDEDLVEASLTHEEFVMREHDFGIADGVIHAINSLAGWLYDEHAATTYLRYEDDFAFLHEALHKGYFNDLARELFLENNHCAGVAVVPQEPAGEGAQEAELAKIAAGLSEDERAAIKAEEALLREMQMAPDSPQAKATLPHLSKDDIEEAPEEAPLTHLENTPVACLRHAVGTHGIAYAYRYFDANHVSFTDLPYVSILTLVLGKLGTAHHTAAEIDTLTQGKLGNLSFFTEVYERADDAAAFDLKFVVSASALEQNASWLATLPREVMLETDFGDTARIRDILQQRKISLEQSFAAAGNSRAMARVRSYYSKAGVIIDQLGNVDFYRFLKGLLANFDDIAETLPTRLASVAAKLFADNNCTVSFTGSDASLDAFWDAKPLCSRAAETGTLLEVPQPTVRNEAFVVPTDVTYTALGFDRRLLGLAYNGAWQVGARALTYDYLWNEVRVKGGAYGVAFQATYTGNMRFSSYRDPHIDETLQRFEGAGAYLRSFDPTPVDMDGFVVSSVATFDAPKKARELIRRQDGSLFAGITPEQRKQVRSEIAEATVDAVRNLGDAVDAVAQKQLRCTFGNKEIIQSAKTPFEVIDLLGE